MDWEEKFNDFKNQEAGEKVSRESELITICKELTEYIKTHPDEIKGQLEYSEGERSDSLHWVSTEKWELDTNIVGHDIYWYCEMSTDQDGGEEDTEGELSIDGESLYCSYYNYSKFSREVSKAVWNLDSEIASLTGTF